MSHTVAVGEFEGPLGVLLDLVERHKLPVSEISVGTITGEYLDYVRNLETASVEDLSEFLQLGARLLYIKSLSLLPAAPEQDQALELAQLRSELAEYQRFKAAAALLAARAAESRTWQRPARPALPATEQTLPPLTLDQLAAAFTRALQLAPETRPVSVIRPHLKLKKVVHDLQRRLDKGFDLHEVIDACRDRLEIIVTFLAVLELVRDGAAVVAQAGQYQPIRVEAARG